MTTYKKIYLFLVAVFAITVVHCQAEALDPRTRELALQETDFGDGFVKWDDSIQTRTDPSTGEEFEFLVHEWGYRTGTGSETRLISARIVYGVFSEGKTSAAWDALSYRNNSVGGRLAEELGFGPGAIGVFPKFVRFKRKKAIVFMLVDAVNPPPGFDQEAFMLTLKDRIFQKVENLGLKDPR